MIAAPPSAARRVVADAIAAGRPRLRRSYRAFLEADVVPPDGPHGGQPFRVATQPCLGPLIDAVDDPRWCTIIVAGPSQSGKTLVGFVGPTAWHLAEHQEPTVVGVPDLNMAADKWDDIAPVFRASPRLAGLMPRTGSGSRGGVVDDVVKFGNGAKMKFMSAKGSNQGKAGFTTRVVAITELAGFTHRADGANQTEAGPLKQIQARQRSHARKARRTYLEGTFTTDDELPATLLATAAVGRLVSPCPHCAALICPDREHLVGWDDASSAAAAAKRARFACPACGQLIDDEQRRASLARVRLLFDGPDGLQAEPADPEQDRLFYRWGGWHNVLLPIGDFAADEWEAAQLDEGSDARDEAERELCQFVWGRPYSPPAADTTAVTAHQVRQRQSPGQRRGVCPDGTKWLTLGVDVGKFNLHYVLAAWTGDGRGHVVDYDVLTVPTASGPDDPGLDVRQAIAAALWQLHEQFGPGVGLRSGGLKSIDRAFVDAGFEGSAVYGFMRKAAAAGGNAVHNPTAVWLPVLGLGSVSHATRKYRQPKGRGKSVRIVGERYFISRNKAERVQVVEVDSDYWKGWLHDRLTTPAGQRGALELFAGTDHTHRDFARHLAAEQPQQVAVPGRGLQTVWRNTRSRANHYLDALNYAAAAGHLAGFRVLTGEPADGGQSPTTKAGKWWKRR